MSRVPINAIRELINKTGIQAGLKRGNLEGGVRLPALMRWPNRIAPGSTRHRLTANYDFITTAAEIAGVG